MYFFLPKCDELDKTDSQNGNLMSWALFYGEEKIFDEKEQISILNLDSHFFSSSYEPTQNTGQYQVFYFNKKFAIYV